MADTPRVDQLLESVEIELAMTPDAMLDPNVDQIIGSVLKDLEDQAFVQVIDGRASDCEPDIDAAERAWELRGGADKIVGLGYRGIADVSTARGS